MGSCLKRTKMILLALGCSLACVCNDDKDNYGPVNLDVLTKLAWHEADNNTSEYSVGKIYNVNHPLYNLYNFLFYSCKNEYCDTCYRYDTSKALAALEINNDTIKINTGYNSLGKRSYLITKLTKEEMVWKYLWSSGNFDHYESSHKVLITKGIGANIGKDTVDFNGIEQN